MTTHWNQPIRRRCAGETRRVHFAGCTTALGDDFGDKSLRIAVRQYLEHYHAERNHQGLGNKIIDPGEEVERCKGKIQCHEGLVECSGITTVTQRE